MSKPKPCIVSGCMNVGTRNFPKDETRLSQWIKAIHKKPGLMVGKSSVICVAHFRPSDFTWASWSPITGTSRKHLKKDAIPSVFPWNKNSWETPSESRDDSIDSDKIDISSRFTLNQNTFDPTKVQRTYARTKFALVEETPAILKIETDNMNGDPLQLTNDYNDKYAADECTHNVLMDMKSGIKSEPDQFTHNILMDMKPRIKSETDQFTHNILMDMEPRIKSETDQFTHNILMDMKPRIKSETDQFTHNILMDMEPGIDTEDRKANEFILGN